MDTLLAKLKELQGPLQASYDAVEKITGALALPFRPVPLQPLADIWRLGNEIAGLVHSVIQENEALKRKIAEIEESK